MEIRYIVYFLFELNDSFDEIDILSNPRIIVYMIT